jgi:hypothetical protein
MTIHALKDLRRPALAGGLVLALACGHTDPFATPPYGTDQPLDPTPPVRLTLNPGPDREASWLPDGSGILYSSQQSGRRDHDVCFAELPPTGGSQRTLICDFSALGGDTLNAVEYPVQTDDGRLAFLKAGNPTNATQPIVEAISVAPSLDPRMGVEVVRTPYTVAGEPTHQTITDLRWLSPTQLAFVGSFRAYRHPCDFCQQVDTIRTGLKVGVLDLATPRSPPAFLSGTDHASGVGRGATADEVYYTLAGDTRVYRRSLATGETAVAHDFGAAGIVRDLHVVGDRLAAIVGGRVTFSLDPDFGPVQWDSGGMIHVVSLSSGSDLSLNGPGLFRRPALSPEGTQLVAEGYPLIITQRLPSATEPLPPPDTTVSRDGDLYLFAAP